MMMGAGLLFMVLIGLLVIGVPLLIAALIAGGGLAKLFNASPRKESKPDSSPPFHEPANELKCPTCGRAVQANWNVCPSCGAALT